MSTTALLLLLICMCGVAHAMESDCEACKTEFAAFSEAYTVKNSQSKQEAFCEDASNKDWKAHVCETRFRILAEQPKMVEWIKIIDPSMACLGQLGTQEDGTIYGPCGCPLEPPRVCSPEKYTPDCIPQELATAMSDVAYRGDITQLLQLAKETRLRQRHHQQQGHRSSHQLVLEQQMVATVFGTCAGEDNKNINKKDLTTGGPTNKPAVAPTPPTPPGRGAPEITPAEKPEITLAEKQEAVEHVWYSAWNCIEDEDTGKKSKTLDTCENDFPRENAMAQGNSDIQAITTLSDRGFDKCRPVFAAKALNPDMFASIQLNDENTMDEDQVRVGGSVLHFTENILDSLQTYRNTHGLPELHKVTYGHLSKELKKLKEVVAEIAIEDFFEDKDGVDITTTVVAAVTKAASFFPQVYPASFFPEILEK